MLQARGRASAESDGSKKSGEGALLRCGDRTLDLYAPVVMGVLNVTPDSFSDAGRYSTVAAAEARARQMVEEGAAIIDVGGESTRPGANPVGTDDECARVLPVLGVLKDCGALLSVDTRNPDLMARALDAGADMINDIAGLRAPGALRAVSGSGCGLCVMHMKGDPRSMQRRPRYSDVVGEVKDFLRERIEALAAAGVDPVRVCVDPGFGFGKTLGHNISLLARLGELGGLGRPVLAGLSRKSMLGKIVGKDVGERVPAGVAAALIALERGARIIRTHDVGETVDALKIWITTRAAQPAPAA